MFPGLRAGPTPSLGGGLRSLKTKPVREFLGVLPGLLRERRDQHLEVEVEA